MAPPHHTLKYVAVIIILTATMNACATTTQTEMGQSTARASGILNKNIERAENIFDTRQRLPLRYNPCDCEPQIPCEIFAYGRWHRVRFTGKNDVIVTLMQKARALTQGDTMNLWVKISDAAYKSKNGQYFWQLEALELDIEK